MPGTETPQSTMGTLAPVAPVAQPDARAVGEGIIRQVHDMMAQMETLGSQIPGTEEQLRSVKEAMRAYLVAAIQSLSRAQEPAPAPRTVA
jgi:hypothetical protein